MDLNSANLASWTRSSALQYLQTDFVIGTRKARDVNHETKLHVCPLTPRIVIYRLYWINLETNKYRCLMTVLYSQPFRNILVLPFLLRQVGTSQTLPQVQYNL